MHATAPIWRPWGTAVTAMPIETVVREILNATGAPHRLPDGTARTHAFDQAVDQWHVAVAALNPLVASGDRDWFIAWLADTLLRHLEPMASPAEAARLLRRRQVGRHLEAHVELCERAADVVQGRKHVGSGVPIAGRVRGGLHLEQLPALVERDER